MTTASKTSNGVVLQLSMSARKLTAILTALFGFLVAGPPILERIAPGPDVVAIELLAIKVDGLTKTVADQAEVVRENQTAISQAIIKARDDRDRTEENRLLIIAFLAKINREHPDPDLRRLIQELR